MTASQWISVSTFLFVTVCLVGVIWLSVGTSRLTKATARVNRAVVNLYESGFAPDAKRELDEARAELNQALNRA